MDEAKADAAMRFWVRELNQASDLLIRRGTAMGPLILLLILEPLFLLAAYLFKDVPLTATILVGIFVAIPLFYCWQYVYFARKDPDRLQSEEYRSEIRRMEIAAKELPHPVLPENLDLAPATSNPAQSLPGMPSLPHQEAEVLEPVK